MSNDTIKLMIPVRKSYKPEPPIAKIEELPFVIRKGRGKNKVVSNWDFPEGLDYNEACQLGNEYATHFLQFMLDSPFHVGSNLLGHIVSDIDFKDDSGAKGVWVGFFSTLEIFLTSSARDLDIWGHLEGVSKRNQEIEAQRQQEVEA